MPCTALCNPSHSAQQTYIAPRLGQTWNKKAVQCHCTFAPLPSGEVINKMRAAICKGRLAPLATTLQMSLFNHQAMLLLSRDHRFNSEPDETSHIQFCMAKLPSKKKAGYCASSTCDFHPQVP